MSYVAFTRMMESGVLRPGDREIRRGPGGIPLYATRQVSDLLNHSLDVLFGSESELDQEKRPKMVLLPKPNKLTPSQPNCSRFSLHAMLVWLGLLDQTNGGSRPEPPSPEILVPRLKARIQKLESLLKAERVLCQAQRDELSKLRVQAKRNDVLEADLAIERDSSAQLVHWLQEAEQELADLRRSFCGAGK